MMSDIGVQGVADITKRRQIQGGGFTLIELLVVVAIIGILAAIAMPRLFNAMCVAKRGNIDASFGSINSALSMYFSENKLYPVGTDISVADIETISNYLEVPQTPWGKDYIYRGNTDYYTICAGVSMAQGCDEKTGDEYRYYSSAEGRILESATAPLTGCE